MYSLLEFSFPTVQKPALCSRGGLDTANMSYNLTESIGNFLFNVLVWAWGYCQCVDLLMPFPKLNSFWSYLGGVCSSEKI